MQQTDSRNALLEYAENASDGAFAAVVQQHIDLVYSVAWRHVGDPHQAEELTQAVFIVLTKKARQIFLCPTTPTPRTRATARHVGSGRSDLDLGQRPEPRRYRHPPCPRQLRLERLTL